MRIKVGALQKNRICKIFSTLVVLPCKSLMTFIFNFPVKYILIKWVELWAVIAIKIIFLCHKTFNFKPNWNWFYWAITQSQENPHQIHWTCHKDSSDGKKARKISINRSVNHHSTSFIILEKNTSFRHSAMNKSKGTLGKTIRGRNGLLTRRNQYSLW